MRRRQQFLTMFQAVELPAGVADLAACLAHVDRDALALGMESRAEARRGQGGEGLGDKLVKGCVAFGG